ncbi:MAG: Holliday junction branch migration DNA helicase RuvB [Bacilli bacterium]|nr:Holliday junction branch migration DNA helicase RuvB [Bacilli bacterium]
MSRVIDAEFDQKENNDEINLRPQNLDSYVGQKIVKENLRIFIGAALHRDEPLDHVLLYGPPGLGKTTLAYIIANEMHAKIHFVTGPSIEKTGDLAALLSILEAGDILFIDEIHRMPKIVEEALYSAMEDFEFNIMINRESGSNVMTLKLPPFTLIGATTKAGTLSSPFRARFGIIQKLDFYDVNEIKQIIERTAKVFNMTIDDDACLSLAKRSRGTPRIANRLFKRVRDFSHFYEKSDIQINDVNTAMKYLKVDDIGLDDVDIKYLKTLIHRFNGGPVGLETLAAAIGEEIDNLEEVYEPYLLQIGFVDRTPRGRIATKKALKYISK